MKKIILAALFALTFPAAAHAVADTTFDSAVRSAEPATNVTTVKSSDTVVVVTIASHTATSVVGDTAQKFRWVDVQNADPNCYIVCGENVISTGTASSMATAAGWILPKASTATVNGVPAIFNKKFDIVPGSDFKCQNGCANTTSRANVMRGR
jgi:hypothetical protein